MTQALHDDDPEPTIRIATYLCATDPRRTKTYPVRAGTEPVLDFRDAISGDVFQLVLVTSAEPDDDASWPPAWAA